MTKEDIARMMRDSHLNVYGLGKDHEKFFTVIERFAALVASAERDACAQVVVDLFFLEESPFHYIPDARGALKEAHFSIRARGRDAA